MAGGGGGGEENYWPGFVDALSNVVLTLIFVLVVFVFALAMLSNKTEKKMKEVIQSQQQQLKDHMKAQSVETTMSSEIEDLQKQLQQALQQVEQLKTQNADLASKNNSMAQTLKQTQSVNKTIQVEKNNNQTKSKKSEVNVGSSDKKIVMEFPLLVAEMDDKSAQEMGTAVSQSMQKGGKKKVIIKSIMGKESLSAARRMAYYRALGVRNHLIQKMGISPSAITSTIVQPEEPGLGRVEIIFAKD